jgi:hypothetical protein
MTFHNGNHKKISSLLVDTNNKLLRTPPRFARTLLAHKIAPDGLFAPQRGVLGLKPYPRPPRRGGQRSALGGVRWSSRSFLHFPSSIKIVQDSK